MISILGITPETLDNALVLRDNRNVDIIERMETELTVKVQEAINAQTALARNEPLSAQTEFLRQNTFYKCLKLPDNSVRQYPEGSAMAQVTGYVDGDGMGTL